MNEMSVSCVYATLMLCILLHASFDTF